MVSLVDELVRVEALDQSQSFLIQAPAGSGKTELLTDRIINLLLTVHKPEEILAVTFSRKSAAEMQSRVIDKLRIGLNDVPPHDRHSFKRWQICRKVIERDKKMGWNLIQYPARLQIKTIDSFCMSLVNQFSSISSSFGKMKIVSQPQLIYEDAIDSILSSKEGYIIASNLLNQLEINERTLRINLIHLLSMRDQWINIIHNFHKRDDLEKVLQHITNIELKNLEKLTKKSFIIELHELIFDAINFLKNTYSEHFLYDLDCSWENFTVKQWNAISKLFLTLSGKLRSIKSFTSNIGFPSKSKQKIKIEALLEKIDPKWIEALNNIKNLPNEKFSDDEWKILQSTCYLLKLCVNSLQKFFLKNGEVDFIEVLQRAIEVLGNSDEPSDSLLKLDMSLQHILIDEFQDVSVNQLHLINLIISGWDGSDGKTIFLVGDPMQSIYSFRKAEVGIFLKLSDTCASFFKNIQIKFLKLKHNFRSQSGLVNWHNTVFNSLFPNKNCPYTGAVKYSSSISVHKKFELSTSVKLHLSNSLNQSLLEDKTIKLIQKGLDVNSKSLNPIALLVRSKKDIGDLIKKMDKEKINYKAEELYPLIEYPVIKDLEQLVRALVHPGDRLAWLSILRAPWCGLSFDALEEFFSNDHVTPVPILLKKILEKNDYHLVLHADEFQRLKYVATVLLKHSTKNGIKSISNRVEEAWHELNGPFLYKEDNNNIFNNSEKFFSLLESLSQNSDFDLRKFNLSLMELFYSSKTNSNQSCVEIMTIHKAKGLEFEWVILYGLEKIPQLYSEKLMYFEHYQDKIPLLSLGKSIKNGDSNLKNYLQSRERQRINYEMDRLLYVASTRARKVLHLVAFTDTEKEPRKHSFLSRVLPFLKEIHN